MNADPTLRRFTRTPLARALQPLLLGLSLATAGLPTVASAQDAVIGADQRQAFDIPAGALEPALNRFGREAGVLLAFSPEMTQGRSTQGLKGEFGVAEGLDRLLAGSGLRAEASDGGFSLRNADDSLALEIDRQVVVGSRAPVSISELPGTVWVIDSHQLQEQTKGGVPLKEALGQLIPGLDIGPQGRTNYGQNMRGRSALVMIDGVSLNSSRGISRQFDSIDPFNIERIEVLSGASAVYGGGATGGIINIVTKRAEAGEARFTSEIGVRSGFETHQDHDWRVAQSVSGGSEQVKGRVSVAYQKNGAAYDGNGDQVMLDITQTDLQYNQAVDVMGSLDFAFDNGQTLNLGMQWYDSGYDGKKGVNLGRDFQGLRGQSPFEVQGGASFDREPHTERQQFNATWHVPEVLGHDFYLQAYYRSEEMAFQPYPSITFTNGAIDTNRSYYSASQQDTDYFGLKSVLVKEWDRVSLTYGADFEWESFDSDQSLFNLNTAANTGGLVADEYARVGRYPGIDTDSKSLFAQASWKATDDLTLSAGVRHQRIGNDVGSFVAAAQQIQISKGNGTSADAVPGGSKDYQVDLYNVGAVYKLSKAQQVWANYSEGFELPDPAKYYGQGSYTLVGNHWSLGRHVNVEDSALDGIKTKQVELGWRHYADGLDAQLAAFYAWSDKSITYNRTTLLVEQLSNKKRNYGLEGQATYWLDDNWQIGASALAIRSQQKIADRWQKQDVTAASPSKLTAFAGWQDGETSLRLQAVRSFNLSDDGNVLANGTFDGNDHRIDGYTTFDLLGSQALPVGTLNFGIQNLLDKDYTTVWGQRAQVFYGTNATADLFDYHGRGRTYSLSYSVEF
ncbi:TonB-dependent receptor [Metapseudomonas otitidis]|uniref:Ferric aerobactin receptor n=1 Tax=Metapseudomonas otitidis TaxID=319939 RepID=A0A6S5RV97_9GAMM|nr:TonB-dependent receptor [Pseudomonas otitidis]BBT18640.1 TonB-dependent receptor [Pseudomonas otitidis]